MSSRKASRQCGGTLCSLPSVSSDPLAASSSSASSTVSSAQSSATVAAKSSTSNAGAIAGGVIGGVIFLVLAVLGALLFLRARKRRRTPPSSEFMNSIRAGAAPVLRLDSGAEYTPALSEKGTAYTRYPPSGPLSFAQNTRSSTPNMKISDEIVIDTPYGRPSVEQPLHPQRYSSRHDSPVAQYYPSTSVGSKRELWGSDTEDMSPLRQSPVHTESVPQFVPRFSLDDPSLPSHSPPPLYPLRRRPDPESI